MKSPKSHILLVDGPGKGRTFIIPRQEAPFDFNFVNYGCSPEEDLQVHYVVHQVALQTSLHDSCRYYLFGFSGALLPRLSMEQIQELVKKHRLIQIIRG